MFLNCLFIITGINSLQQNIALWNQKTPEFVFFAYNLKTMQCNFCVLCLIGGF